MILISFKSTNIPPVTSALSVLVSALSVSLRIWLPVDTHCSHICQSYNHLGRYPLLLHRLLLSSPVFNLFPPTYRTTPKSSNQFSSKKTGRTIFSCSEVSEDTLSSYQIKSKFLGSTLDTSFTLQERWTSPSRLPTTLPVFTPIPLLVLAYGMVLLKFLDFF